MIFEVGAPPPKIDPHMMASLKVTEWGGYGRNTRGMKRNQVENTRTTEKTSACLQAPKFLSEKAREAANDASLERRISDAADAIGTAELSSMRAEVPVMYRNVEIKYSKFGVDDFDFGYVARHSTLDFTDPLASITKPHILDLRSTYQIPMPTRYCRSCILPH